MSSYKLPSLGTYYSLLNFFFHTTVTFTSDNNPVLVATDIAIQESQKETRKKKVKDDTEQTIYACEECTQCFTTQTDLKVLFVLYIAYSKSCGH